MCATVSATDYLKTWKLETLTSLNPLAEPGRESRGPKQISHYKKIVSQLPSALMQIAAWKKKWYLHEHDITAQTALMKKAASNEIRQVHAQDIIAQAYGKIDPQKARLQPSVQQPHAIKLPTEHLH